MAKPEKRFKVGPCIASVFSNSVDTEGGRRAFKTVQLQRVYKDGAGQFKYTGSFRYQDLPNAILVLEQAFEYLNGDQRTTPTQ